MVAGPPLTPDRATGQRWARSELTDPAYGRARPSLLSRGWDWLLRRLDQLSGGHGLGPGRLLALAVLVALVIAVIVLVARRGVRLRVARAAQDRMAVLGQSTLTADQHRALAAQARDQGRYDDAVRESMRAIARRLEERALLDPRPGRTADELAREAGAVLAPLAADLERAARWFDDVAYGEVPADRDRADAMSGLDRDVQQARPSAGATAAAGWVMAQ